MSRCEQEFDEELGVWHDVNPHAGWMCAPCLANDTYQPVHILCDHIGSRLVFGEDPDVCARPICGIHVRHDKRRGDLCPLHAWSWEREAMRRIYGDFLDAVADRGRLEDEVEAMRTAGRTVAELLGRVLAQLDADWHVNPPLCDCSPGMEHPPIIDEVRSLVAKPVGAEHNP